MIETTTSDSDSIHAVSTKRILLNAFDMCTVGHLSPGQWKNCKDHSASKRKLDYWINLAKLLERGGINALFLADTYGEYDTFEGSLDNCIRRPISAMAAVSKNLAFAITASTSFEPPFLLAKRFSTLDWMTGGSFAIGIDTPIEHDERYAQADEYLRADDAITENGENDEYIDPSKIWTIKHDGKYFHLESRHIVNPSTQRTAFLFQAGTSSAGSEFAATHAEAIFVSSHSPLVLRRKIDKIRQLAAQKGREPQSIKFFATFAPILGSTDEEAQEKYRELKKYAIEVGGLVLVSGWTGINLSKYPPDHVLTPDDATEDHRVRSLLDQFTVTSPDVPVWTPRIIAEKASIGRLGPVVVDSPATVADELELWVREAGVDGFNIAYITTPGSFEDVVNLLVPELRNRGIYAEVDEQSVNDGWTAREKVYERGQAKLRNDHVGSKYKYKVYDEKKVCPPASAHPNK
ncbi:HK97 family phage prohead protease [Dothidotthia symphoricarpi CBS 119687]|uniref:HK97 family phage prohead protease n=1 Tax=Dothidotthia symphoricarpi CBS 119687 TaxID=1392245 RepID=A0A6A6A8R9_9PLEO|nr:HK97 family phage prohead protease [Dothidotthia symphoricarpi CBS 119687]KAF2127041.1 HK97 family phage prohead protease [Dothidotthia symphoricarpi CBS 119687]